ncbi:MAG TPA: ectonucleotide pyrophosphatase/phosphodiesterase, partial [Edaphobacter sp.]|nr:ectonucleotide pyrophosphatase/phosphodiesterase [Edaphobacter sp.]
GDSMHVQRRIRAVFSVLAVVLCLAAQAQKPSLSPALPLVYVEHGPNSPAAQKAHYVVLVSFDGLRWNLARQDGAAHLLAFAKQGVWAPDGMLPSFPSLTFPNHLTLVTGLYPEHHGIIANKFWDEKKQANYISSDDAVVNDGSWYSGVPLWSLAESQGMRTACLFWPGSGAEIAGQRPTWYARWDNKTQGTDAVQQARVDDAVALLHLPESERPHLITIYNWEPDHSGHLFGPDSPEAKAAVIRMDEFFAKLKKALDGTGLPIDLVVISDHGLAKIEGSWITLSSFADLKGFQTVGSLLYAENEEDRKRVYDQLKKASADFVVYRRNRVPADLHYDQNPREGDPVVIATGPYAIRAKAPDAGKPDKAPDVGGHGYDPHGMQEMKASFFAAGPDIVQGKTVAPFENVNLYPWIAHLLGLTTPKNDGTLNVLSGTLRDNGGATPEPVEENSK